MLHLISRVSQSDVGMVYYFVANEADLEAYKASHSSFQHFRINITPINVCNLSSFEKVLFYSMKICI